jgi:phage replication-related protein YjqB (UPF0714/DUF867 family)
MDFDARRVDRLASADIVVDLHGLEDATWSEWRGIGGDQQPRKLSQGELAKQLRRFRFPKSVWPLGPRAAGQEHERVLSQTVRSRMAKLLPGWGKRYTGTT